MKLSSIVTYFKKKARISHAGLPPAHQEMKMGRLAPLSVILDIFNRGSRVFGFFFVREENDTGFPITNVGNDSSGHISYFPTKISGLAIRLTRP